MKGTAPKVVIHEGQFDSEESVDELDRKGFYVTDMRTRIWHVGSKPHHAIWGRSLCV